MSVKQCQPPGLMLSSIKMVTLGMLDPTDNIIHLFFLWFNQFNLLIFRVLTSTGLPIFRDLWDLWTPAWWFRGVSGDQNSLTFIGPRRCRHRPGWTKDWRDDKDPGGNTWCNMVQHSTHVKGQKYIYIMICPVLYLHFKSMTMFLP